MLQKPIVSKQATVNFLNDKFGLTNASIKLLSGGEWSQAILFTYNKEKHVLRWSNSSEGFEKDRRACFLNSEDMPIPKITDMGVHSGIYYAISEFAEGTPVEELSQSQLEKTSPALIKLLNTLRTANTSNTSGYGGWDKNGSGEYDSWKEYLLSIKKGSEKDHVSGWWNNLHNSPIGTVVFDQLYSRLELLVDACPQSRELIHSDLLNKNLLIVDNRISAVIDWQCSLYGDSLYEIAWFAFNTLWYPQINTTKLLQKAIVEYKSLSKNISNIETRMLCYQIHIGLGSIAYNSFKKDWKMVEKSINFTQQLVQN